MITHLCQAMYHEMIKLSPVYRALFSQGPVLNKKKKKKCAGSTIVSVLADPCECFLVHEAWLEMITLVKCLNNIANND